MTTRRVINTLNHVIEKYGKPNGIRKDNGPEFTSHLFQKWLEETKKEWVKIQKNKTQQNAIIEEVNRTNHEDILDSNLFRIIDIVRDLTKNRM